MNGPQLNFSPPKKLDKYDNYYKGIMSCGSLMGMLRTSFSQFEKTQLMSGSFVYYK